MSEKRPMKFVNGLWVIGDYRFTANSDYTLARGTKEGCELVGPDLEEGRKVFEREIDKWFME